MVKPDTGQCRVVIFGALGDCVNSTTLLLPLRTKYDRIVWVTKRKFVDVVKQNPLVDAVQVYEDDASGLSDVAVPSDGVIAPAPYLDGYGNHNEMTLLEWFKYVRVRLELPALEPFEPLLYLSDEERAAAQKFAAETGRFVLIESAHGSGQSYWNDECTRLAINRVSLAGLEPVMVSHCKPPWVTSLAKLGYREVAALYDHAAGFIGVSSGISCLVGAQCFRRDVPHVEFVSGEHWSTSLYRKDRKLIVLKPELVPAALDWLIEQIGGR